MTQTHIPSHFIEKVSDLLSVPGSRDGSLSHEVYRFFWAWERAEGGTAEWDPLNTTNHLSDAWGPWQYGDYNSTSVVNYKDQFDGIVGTAATLHHSPNFQGIVSDLRSGQYAAEQMVERNASAIKTWGTSPTLMLEILAGIS